MNSEGKALSALARNCVVAGNQLTKHAVISIACVSFWLIVISCLGCAEESSGVVLGRSGVVEVGTRKYLLFDDALTEEKEGFVLTMNRPIRDKDPVLTRERPWEAGGIQGRTAVLEDEGQYKLWYMVWVPASTRGHRDRLSADDVRGPDNRPLSRHRWKEPEVLCYATSQDGIHWERPNLGIFQYKGSKQNNMVFAAPKGATVFRDPSAGPAERYKMIYGGGPYMPHVRRDQRGYTYPAYCGIYGAHSVDGIHWKSYRKPIMPWYDDTIGVCYWDDSIGKYVAFVRWNENMTYKNGKTILGRKGWEYRAIGRSESDDFRSFPQPAKIAEPTEEELAPGPGRLELYNSGAIKYPFAADTYFMFPSYFYSEPDTLDIHLATSRDGVNYSRWAQPFVGLGRPGAVDSKMLYMGAGMIRRGDEIYMYYDGFDYLHGVKRLPYGHGAIGRVRIRLDGFVSQDASASGGYLITVPLMFGGNRLEVNMAGGADGSLKVELLDDSNDPIPGYSEQDADRLSGDDVRKTVTWNGQSDLSALAGKTVRLKFIGKSVKLYAFQFVE